jgi:hypothetical protein
MASPADFSQHLSKGMKPPDPSPARTVFCTGMPRSGSTWSFNVVLNLLKVTHPTAQIESLYSETAAQLLEDRRADFLVVKCHFMDPVGQAAMSSGAVPSVYTARDPREAVCSMMVFAGATFEDSLGAIIHSLEFYEAQRRFGGIVAISYADIVSQPYHSISRIADHLGVTADSASVSEVERLCARDALGQISANIETFGADEVHREDRYLYHLPTLIHRHHFTDSGVAWREHLSADQCADIEAQTRAWASEFGWRF